MEKPNENKKEQSASYKARNGLIGSLVFGAITALVACWIHAKFREFPIGQIITFILALMAFLLFMVAISCFFDLREAKRIERMEEDARNEEKELAEIDPAQKALKAEKLYRVNQKELMRYYDMNIAQTKFLSILGIIMIIAGIVIVAATCYVYITMKYDKALLLVGNISGIIVNFIGAIFYSYVHKKSCRKQQTPSCKLNC